MRFIYFFILAFSSSIAAIEKSNYLNFEQALYFYLQQDYLDAISISEILTDKNKQAGIQQQVLLSNSYFKYQLPEVSLAILNSSLDNKPSKADQDILLFNIGKNQYEHQEIESALDTFTKILEPINPKIIHHLNYLLGDIYIRKNALNQAEKTAKKLQGDINYFPYMAHNLAIALLNNRQRNKALIWVNALNDDQYSKQHQLKNSLRLAIGISFLRDKKFNQAIELLLQIEKQSPYSAKGLLALGRALNLIKKHNEGSRFYNYLSNYPKQNLYYQESLLYLAESSQGDTSKQLLKHAISNYNDLISELEFLSSDEKNADLNHCLLNNIDNEFCQKTGLWISSLNQTVPYKNSLLHHQQLLDIQNTLIEWSQKFHVYDFILSQRQDDFNNKLPAFKSKVNPTQLAQFKQQYTALKNQVFTYKSNKKTFAFINENESEQLDDINYVAVTIKRINKEAIEGLKERALFAKGILMWDLAQKKPTRLRQATKNIKDIELLLNAASSGMDKLQQFNDFGDIRLSRLKQTLAQAKQTLQQLAAKVDQLIKRNQRQLNALTTHYLLQRRATLIRLNSRSKFLLTQRQDVQP